MAFIVAFSVVLVLIISFFAFKVFEQSRDLVWYTQYRTQADAVVIEIGHRVHRHALYLEEKFSFKNISHVVVHQVAAFVAHAARRVELHAQNVTRKMSRSRAGQARATRSPFFEKIVLHKKGLDTERVKRETSLTESEE